MSQIGSKALMAELEEDIHRYLSDPAHNALRPDTPQAAFGAPLVAAARGDDELFAFLQADIGPDFYWTPLQALALAFPQASFEAGQVAVISWILPHAPATRMAHRQAKTLPSIEWSLGRHFGEHINNALRQHVVEYLSARGIPAMAPALHPAWSRQISARYGFASNWSERHAAYVCGLGTFGLSDGLITRAGKAMRVGSVVAALEVDPAVRDYQSHHEWCLYFARGSCKACAKRCPAGAISEAGHDKQACKDYIRGVTAPYVQAEQLGYPVNSCGLCQVATPCEAGIPKVLLKQAGARLSE